MVQRRLGSSRAAVEWGDVLELQGLTRRYGDVVALDDLSFTVAEGQMFGFVGPNGAGKTTAMRIILGVLAPDAGEVHWRGRPMMDEMHKHVGYMPEERGLYPKMRVRDQLEYFARLHGLSRGEAHDSAAYWIERLGVAERAGDRVEQLSLGNQQRVQLAAALVHGPELLVLDEPFSGLDPVGVDMLAAGLGERAARGDRRGEGQRPGRARAGERRRRAGAARRGPRGRAGHPLQRGRGHPGRPLQAGGAAMSSRRG